MPNSKKLVRHKLFRLSKAPMVISSNDGELISFNNYISKAHPH